MSFVHSPKIVTDGLVLALDAGNTKSYTSGSTTWYDKSGNTNNGTLTNGPTFSSANGGSIVFDGTNDFVLASSVQNLPNLNANFTINVFTKPTVASYGNIIVLADSGYSNECQLILNINTILVSKYGGTSLITGGSISLNIWYNITYVQNSNVGFLYLNGSLLQSNSITPQTPSISNVILGSYNTSGPQPYGGYISTTQIYNRALSASEIQQNFNALRGRYGI